MLKNWACHFNVAHIFPTICHKYSIGTFCDFVTNSLVFEHDMTFETSPVRHQSRFLCIFHILKLRLFQIFLQNLLTWMNMYPNVSLALTIFAETIFWSFLSPTVIELWRHTHLGCLTYQGTWPLGFNNTAANPCNSLLKKLIKKKRRIAKPEWQNMFAEGETSPLPIH